MSSIIRYAGGMFVGGINLKKYEKKLDTQGVILTQTLLFVQWFL